MTVHRDVVRPVDTATPQRYAWLVGLLLSFGILVTIWIRGRWALSVFQAGTFLVASAWIVRALRRSLPIEGGLCVGALAGTVVWGLLQLALGWSIYRWDTSEAILGWTTNLAMCFLTLQICVTRAVRWRFLRAVVYFGFALSVLATVQAYSSAGALYWIWPSGYERVFGPFLYTNQYAAFLESIVPIAMTLALREPRRSILFVSATAMMVASVVASASRAGTGLILVEIIATLLLALRSGLAARKTVLATVGSLLAVGVLAVAIVGWSDIWRRFQEPDPFAVRRELIQSTHDMIRDRPWFGLGLGTWATAYPRYARFDDGRFANQAHNDWLQWTAEGGIPFLLLMATIAIWSIRPAVHSVWGVGLLAVFGHAWFDYPMQQRPALAAWFFALLGVLAASHNAAAASRTASDSPPMP